MASFVALDFETADHGRDSACSIGLVRVENRAIVRSEHFLIKPPRQSFVFTALHGISWDHVKDAPSFGELWPGLAGFFAGTEFIAAHNSGFDRGVLNACCAGAGLKPPEQPFRCTVQLARKVLNIRPANLSHVCRHLCIKLNHHNALSDAEACARIMIAVLETEAEAQNPA